jgi:hypothetical protein
MKTHIEMLKEMGVSNDDADQYIDDLEQTLPKYGNADSTVRLAHRTELLIYAKGLLAMLDLKTTRRA